MNNRLNLEVENVKCNNCDWKGNEEDLTLVEFDINDDLETPTATDDNFIVSRISEEPTEIDYLKGCPKCLTDNYLTDIE